MLNKLFAWMEERWILSIIILSVFAFILFLATPSSSEGAEPLTEKQGYTLLSSAVAKLRQNNKDSCTAFKVGPKQYMTASHCVGGFPLSAPILTIFIEEGYIIEQVRSFTISNQKKKGGKLEDWAVINTVDDTDQVALSLACTEEVEPADRVATYGYPGMSHPQFSTGIVTGEGPHTSGHGSEIIVSLHVDGGASGSPVISLETGSVIGVLTEGIPGRFGQIGTGLEKISNSDMCEDVIDYQAWQEENAQPSPF